jgi:hypothetical protein
MSALAGERRLRREVWKRRTFKLPTGKTAWKNGIAVYDESAGKAIPAETGAGQTDLFVLGFFNETVANSSGGDLDVVVELKREVHVVWFANDGTNPVTATDLGKDVYAVDDQTASISNATSTRSVLGTAWALDATLGVAVEMK